MKDFWRAVKYAFINKRLAYLAVFLAMILTAIDLMFPLFTKNIFDIIEQSIKNPSANTSFKLIVPWLVIYGILLIIQTFTSQFNMYVINRWWVLTEKALTQKAFSHLQSLSLSYFEKQSTGKVKERVDRGISDLVNIIDRVVLDVLPQLIYIIVAIIILLKVQLIFGLILLACVPFYLVVSYFFSPKVLKFQDKMRTLRESISGVTTESIINVKTIKSYATEKKHFNKLTMKINQSITAMLNYTVGRAKMNIIRVLPTDFAQVLILGLGAYWTMTGRITLGTLTLAWQYTNRSIQPLWWIARVVDDVQRDMRSVKRVFELFDTEPEIKDSPEARKLKLKKGNILFKDVKFKYDNRHVINGMTLGVPAGSVVAFVGKSGVGKTTLVKLLMRFYDPQKGSIFIDGQNIKDVTQKSLRQNIGYVLQDSALFNDTVHNNVSYGASVKDKNNVIKAAQVANADEFIKRLPKGYNTIVGERGVKLSGGEQQRINIARAVLKNPPILILDEATSSLDSESELLVQDALWRLIEGKTTLIIAHRLSTIMRADLIVVMDKGKISEIGTHKDLVAKKGIYAKLFEIQSGGYLK